MVSVMVPRGLLSTEKQLINALGKNSEVLAEINAQFTPLMKQFHMFFFWEELRTTKINDYVVDKSSAVPALIANIEQSGLPADHSGMTKFASADAGGFSVLSYAILKYCREAPKAISIRWPYAEEHLRNEQVSKINQMLGPRFLIFDKSKLPVSII
jgi:protein SERAC1